MLGQEMANLSQFQMYEPRRYKVPWRFELLSTPRRQFILKKDVEHVITPQGVRKSALNAKVSDRIKEISYPHQRNLKLLKEMYKDKFNKARLSQIDELINTIRGKHERVMDIKREAGRPKKSKAWTDSDWKKHGDYLAKLSEPRRLPTPKSEKKKNKKIIPLQQLLLRLTQLASLPEFKVYRRLSKESWYRPPGKVSPKALAYVISDRVKKLAEPKTYPEEA